MIAVILAAGQGSRLRPLTNDIPKCLVPVRGKPLLEHILDSLRAGGVDRIAIVTGYRAETIRKYGLIERHNPDYDRTNMVTSLFRAADLMTDDLLVVYGDILFKPEYIRALAKETASVALAVNTRWRQLWDLRMENPLDDAETLKIDAFGNVIELGKKAKNYDEIQGQYTGLIRFSAAVAKQLPDFHDSLDQTALYDGRDFNNMFMTTFLTKIIDRLVPVKAVPVDGGWAEIDSPEDINVVERLPESELTS